MYKEALVINKIQGLICHKTKLKRIIYIYLIYVYKEDFV